jgi:hypothetical protein
MNNDKMEDMKLQLNQMNNNIEFIEKSKIQYEALCVRIDLLENAIRRAQEQVSSLKDERGKIGAEMEEAFFELEEFMKSGFN